MIPTPPAADWIEPAIAAVRLGVNVEGLRAYAARGLIVQREDGAVAAAGLARLLRSRTAAAPAETRAASTPAPVAPPALLLDTALTEVTSDAVRHLGRDAAVLAQRATLEDMARLLWRTTDDPFSNLKPRPVAMLGADPRARALSFLAARAALDAPSAGRAEAALVAEAGTLLTDLTDTLCGAARAGPLHERLAKTWRLDGAKADAVRQALVLCADEGLDAATVAVRVAAASGASLASSLLAGVAVMGGPGETGETLQAGQFIVEARRLGDARVAVKQRLELNLPLPGFGASAHSCGDPRARALALALPWSDDIRDLASVAKALGGRPYGMDFALAAFGRTLGLPGDAGVTIRLLGRCTGWLGHALEQRRSGEALHYQARYVGPAAETPVAKAAAPRPVDPPVAAEQADAA